MSRRARTVLRPEHPGDAPVPIRPDRLAPCRSPGWYASLMFSRLGTDCPGRDFIFGFFLPASMERPRMALFAYFTPEVALPVASALAAAFGFLMMIGRAPFRLAARGLRAVFRGRKSEN